MMRRHEKSKVLYDRKEPLMLTNVMLTNLLLLSLLIRVARFMLGQPACAGSFHAYGHGESANDPSLARSLQASLGQSNGQPVAKISTIAALRVGAASGKSTKPFSQKDVCQKALVTREALDAYFALMANEPEFIRNELPRSSVYTDAFVMYLQSLPGKR
jgi:hypothetical protein